MGMLVSHEMIEDKKCGKIGLYGLILVLSEKMSWESVH